MRKNKKKMFIVLLLSTLIFGAMNQEVLHEEKKDAITADAVAATGQLKVVVRDVNSNLPIPDVEFNVTNWLGRVVTTMKSNQYGEATATIGIGIYKVKETNAPAGYVLNTRGQLFTIFKNSVTSVNFANTKEQSKVGKLIIKAIDLSTGSPLSNVEFSITDTTGKTISTVRTNEFGETQLELSIGTYQVRETKAPSGYAQNAGVQTIVVTMGSTNKVQFLNAKLPPAIGKFVVQSYDSVTNSVLRGSEFEVVDAFGKTISKLVTNENGEASVQLAPGNYQIKQTKATLGYMFNFGVQPFTIFAGGSSSVQFYNAKAPLAIGTLVAKAYGLETKAPIQGVEFNVIDATGKVVSTIITQANGEASSTLPIGEYQLKQVKVPTGYMINGAAQSFTLVIGSTVTATFYNTTLTENVGKIIAKAYDNETKAPIEGVEFSVTAEDGTRVTTIKTNRDGEASAMLPVGSYTLKQIKVPSTHTLSSNVYSFSAVANNTKIVTFFTLKTPPAVGQLVLRAIDFNTDVAIPGVEFDVIDINGKVVTTLTTNTKGEGEVQLPSGDYKIKQTKVPADYRLTESEQSISIKTGYTMTASMYNLKR